MINNPYKIVRMFEEEIANYTGSPYAVSVDSCTNAIFLVLKYLKDVKGIDTKKITIPSKTYLSVPHSIVHAGYDVVFDRRPDTNHWSGVYKLEPLDVYDAAKRLTSGMYIPGSFMCLSFHIKKLLPIGKGGMILCDNDEAYEWFKKARYEGRSEKYYKDDDITFHGWNMYMTPQEASVGLALFQNYPKHQRDLDELNGYRDLTEFTVFKDCEVIG